MAVLLYFLHNIISRLGSKITSVAIMFILLARYDTKALPISIFLFSIDPLINIIFSNVYSKILNNFKNFKILIFLDFLNAILIFLVFLFSYDIVFMLAFYFVLSILLNLASRYNRGLFFTLTKNTKKEEWYYKTNSRIGTILSIVSPAMSGVIITNFGNEKSFVFDSVSFLVGAVIYLLICDKLKEVCYNREEMQEDNLDKNFKYKFTTMLNNCSNDFKFICIIFICVAFITNFEEPLIFNYLSLNRNFSKELIGISLSIFSIGMFLGSFIYDYIPKNPYGMFVAVVLDGVFSFLLSLNINKYFIIMFYMFQGIMAVIIMIYFNVSIQNEFETSDSFMQFQNQLDKVLSIFVLISYIFGLILSNFIGDSSLILKIMSMLEILTVLICLLFWRKLNINMEVAYEKAKR